MRKTFKFKLYKSKRNKTLNRQINISSQIYNHCIALHKRYYRLFGKYLSPYKLKLHLTKLKKLERYSHWNFVGSQAVQDIAERIHKAYQLFFEGIKEGRTVSPPNFKKRFKYKSFTLKQAGYKLLDGNKIRIGKKIFGYHKSRDIQGIVKTVTVKRDRVGDFFLCFSCELPDSNSNRTMTGKIAGFDFGLKTFLTPSQGADPIKSPLFFKESLKEIKKANRKLSRKKKGSNNRKKARINLARVHRRVANRRQDYHFKLAGSLSQAYDHLFFEDLDLAGMKARFGRKVSDLGFYNFQKILEHCCKRNGAVIGRIDRFFPSSKLCGACSHKNESLGLRDRSWSCPECGTFHDRDKNAADNILREGASSLGLGSVGPSLAAAPA